jgi:hypothetical protein
MQGDKLTYQEACRLFWYVPETGKLYWKVSTSFRVKIGDEAGCTSMRSDTRSYVVVRIHGVLYAAHRICWLLHYGQYPKQDIDHINGDGTLNTPENMRDVSRSVNNKNTIKRRNNTTGYSNISKYNSKNGKGWEKQYFIVQCKGVDGRKVSKFFESLDEAVSKRGEILLANGYTKRYGSAT